jgi:UDP-4-amino-4,6-dideoxy-N-acetyl-beta-L-altrosamine transaminase
MRTDRLAIDGGAPVRCESLPYGRHSIDESDVQAVVSALRSEWITCGPWVHDFEEAFAEAVNATYAVSFSSGTAALHAAVFAAGLEEGDEAITCPLTFCATANCVLYHSGHVRFADIDEATLLIDPEKVEELLSGSTRVILPVDYGGQPADLDAIMRLAEKRGIVVIEDACHALGASYAGRRVGSVSHMTAFSLHPVKHVTAGEGGMVTTDQSELAQRLRTFRNHGIDTDARSRNATGTWYYEMIALGFNYRLSDIASALGRSQLSRLPEMVGRRRDIAASYDNALADVAGIRLPVERSSGESSWHLYPIRVRLAEVRADRAGIVRALHAEGIGASVHYIPVYLHPYYQRELGYGEGICPVSEQAYEELISLPIFPGMTDQDVEDVIDAVVKVMGHYAK